MNAANGEPMEHFRKLQDVANITALEDEVLVHLSLFGQYPLRTAPPQSPHVEVTDILLRGPDLTLPTLVELQCAIPCEWYIQDDSFPQVREAISHLMDEVEGDELGRVILTRLEAGGQIYEHVDEGDAARYYRRYHIVVSGGERNEFFSGDECVGMHSGEVWWVDNLSTHSVENNMDTTRYHIVLDIRTREQNEELLKDEASEAS